MFRYSEIPKTLQERQRCHFLQDYCKVLYEGPQPKATDLPFQPTWVTKRYQDHAERIKRFSVRGNDVWVASYPKTGTTLTVEMVSVLLSGLDYKSVESTDITKRGHFLELSALSQHTPDDYVDRAEKDPNRRIMKTHLQVNLMPEEVMSNGPHRVIYVVRNPKDAAVSFFHHHKNIHGYGGTLEDFLDDFLLGELPFGSYFQHVEEFCQVTRALDNFLLIRYEDMLSDDGCEVVKKVAHFLNVPLSDEETRNVVEFLDFDKMKNRKNSNMDAITGGNKDTEFRFMRKGKIGSFMEEMSEEYIERFNEETRKWKNVSELYPC